MRPHAKMVLQCVGLLLASAMLVGQAATGCVFGWADDCARNGHFGDACKPGGSSSSVGGGGSSSTSTMNTGGTTGCTKDSECPALPPPGPCQDKAAPKCTAHTCGF